MKLRQVSEFRIVILSKNESEIEVNKEEYILMGCVDEIEKNNKDFCSSFIYTKDFYQKLFTLTPDDLSKSQYVAKGYVGIVHRKGKMFYRVSDIMIYKGGNSVAYRMDFKDSDMSIKRDLLIFTEAI